MGEEFFVQLVLLLLGRYLDRKAARAKQKNSPIIIVAGDVYIINGENDRD